MSNWRLDAACLDADPALFFGDDGEDRRARRKRELRAAAICGGCPVRLPCLEFAQAHRIGYGVWGGTGEGGRKPGGTLQPGMCTYGLHLMNAANTYVNPQGWEICRACRAARDRQYRQRRRQQEQLGRAALCPGGSPSRPWPR